MRQLIVWGLESGESVHWLFWSSEAVVLLCRQGKPWDGLPASSVLWQGSLVVRQAEGHAQQ